MQKQKKTLKEFTREAWRHSGHAKVLSLTPEEIVSLQGVGEELSVEEIEDIYLPLSRFLNLRVKALQQGKRSPYVIGVTGSVGVGKSTVARVVQALISHWPDQPHVDLVSTDGFLYPTAELEKRDLMCRKGFPETFDWDSMLDFFLALKNGKSPLKIPVYSHEVYDLVPGKFQTLHQPEVVIIEGIAALQNQQIADLMDFSIYVDAEPAHIKAWFIERFMRLREEAKADKSAYFHRFATLTNSEALAFAEKVWREINEPNLRENILPTRERASLILKKGKDHSVKIVQLQT